MRKSSSAALFSLTPATMLPLMMLQLIVVVLCSLVAVVDAYEAAKGPWSMNSSVPLTGHGCCQPGVSQKFNFSFLFPFLLFRNRAITTRIPLFPPTSARPTTSKTLFSPSHSKSALPTSKSALPTLNQESPFPPHRNCICSLSSPLRPPPPHWLLPPSSPPHAVTGTPPEGLPNDRNPIFDATDWCLFATVDLCHFPRTSTLQGPLNTYRPPRVDLAPSCFNPDFPQSDSIKVVSIHLSASSFPRWSSTPVDATLVFSHCNLSVPQQGRERFAPPTPPPPKMNMSHSLQSDFVGKYSRCTQNGMVDVREYCQTQSHFPESLTFTFEFPVSSVHNVNILCFRITSIRLEV